MDDKIQIELRISKLDESLETQVLKELKNVEIIKGKTTRSIDPVTVLAITAGAITLANNLIELYKNLRNNRKKDLSKVVIKNFDGKEICFENCSEELIRDFFKDSER